LLVKRTLATLRKAEFGFLGVVVYTRMQTPLRCGHLSNAPDLLLYLAFVLPLRINCCIVGIDYLDFLLVSLNKYYTHPVFWGCKGSNYSFPTYI
jgi:hypothetical protein